jgi:hypothetical protein
VVALAYNPSTQEVEVRQLRVRGQPGLHSETQSQKNKSVEDFRIKLLWVCSFELYLSDTNKNFYLS